LRSNDSRRGVIIREEAPGFAIAESADESFGVTAGTFGSASVGRVPLLPLDAFEAGAGAGFCCWANAPGPSPAIAPAIATTRHCHLKIVFRIRSAISTQSTRISSDHLPFAHNASRRTAFLPAPSALVTQYPPHPAYIHLPVQAQTETPVGRSVRMQDRSD